MLPFMYLHAMCGVRWSGWGRVHPLPWVSVGRPVEDNPPEAAGDIC